MSQISLAGKHILPKGWQAKRLKFLCEAELSGVWGDEPENCEHPTAVATTSDIDADGNTDIAGMNRRCLTNEERERFLCQTGDIIVVKSSGSATNVITGKATLVPEGEEEFAFSNFMLRLRPRRNLVEPEFLFRFLMSPAVKDEIRAMVSTTTYPNLQVGEYLSFSVPLPRVSEQRQIVAFLDEQTAKIDRLMGLRRRQMELLREQRAALIQQAVTRGLNPDAPLKDSGIPWLGQIPEHWPVVTLGRLALLLQTGPFGSQLHASDYIEGGVPVINPSHMEDGLIHPDSKCTVDIQTAQRLERHFLRAGDVIFARRGELGRCVLVRAEEVNWLCGTGSLLMRPDTRVLQPAYLVTLFQLKRIKESLTLQSVGATMDNLNTGILARTGLPLPPLDEQRAILQFIEREGEKFGRLAEAYARQLILLAEYRAALIHECVTGQRTVLAVRTIGKGRKQ